MSGHSKWNSIKHKKAITDAKKGKILTKHSKILAVAGRNDPNPTTNTVLRAAILNAKADNVPNENIERILKKLSGEKNGATFSEQVYEGYGPCGVPFIVVALTDNTNRTVSNVKIAFTKNGGVLGNAGGVRFLFDHVGIILVKTNKKTEDELLDIAAEAGAEDIFYDEQESEILTSFINLGKVRDALVKNGIEVVKTEVQYRAKDPKVLQGAELEKVEKFESALSEVDDVDEVYFGAVGQAE